MIEQYISDLVSSKDEVVVPGLGTFMTTLVESKVVGTDILPPNKKIAFYPRLQQDKNNLLKTTVMAAEGLSESDFDEHLQVFIGRVNTALEANGRAEFPDLGLLVKNPNGDLEFRQDETLNFLPDAYGLPRLTRTPIGKTKNPAVTENQTKDDKTEVPAATNATATQTGQTTPDAQKTTTEPKSRDGIMWFIIFPLLIGFAFLFYYFTQRTTPEENLGASTEVVDENNENNENTGMIVQDDRNNATSHAAAQEEAQPQDPPEEERVENHRGASTTTSNSPKVKTKSNEASEEKLGASTLPNGTFTVSVGSYNNNTAAQKALKKLIGAVPDAKVVNSNGIYRIVVGTFGDQASAQKRRNELRGQFSGAWVLKI